MIGAECAAPFGCRQKSSGGVSPVAEDPGLDVHRVEFMTMPQSSGSGGSAVSGRGSKRVADRLARRGLPGAGRVAIVAGRD